MNYIAQRYDELMNTDREDLVNRLMLAERHARIRGLGLELSHRTMRERGERADQAEQRVRDLEEAQGELLEVLDHVIRGRTHENT